MTDFGTLSDQVLTAALRASMTERNPSPKRLAFRADMRDEVGFRLYCATRIQADDDLRAFEMMMALDSPHITPARIGHWAARYNAAVKGA